MDQEIFCIAGSTDGVARANILTGVHSSICTLVALWCCDASSCMKLQQVLRSVCQVSDVLMSRSAACTLARPAYLMRLRGGTDNQIRKHYLCVTSCYICVSQPALCFLQEGRVQIQSSFLRASPGAPVCKTGGADIDWCEPCGPFGSYLPH